MVPLSPLIISVSALFAFVSLVAARADAVGEVRPSLVAAAFAEPPVLDGAVLDDPVWAAVEAATGFWQVEPFLGQPASERTEVRIGYTGTTLYVGVVCYDSEPGSLVVSDSRRDSSLDSADSFQMIVDTFRDRQNGFVFGTNPAGIEYDAQVSNQGEGGGRRSSSGFNLNWDGSWEVVARRGDFGWSAELAIPFKTLRYRGAGPQEWGLNFQRNIRRKNERAYWAPLDLQYNLYQVSEAGVLRGLEAPRQRNLKLSPYVLGSGGRAGDPGAESESQTEAGLDLKYGVTSSLTLDVTYNTDFAQVEADEQQINLNRFNLFFPEKRPFFLENASLFSVGNPGNVELFFSRRVGLDEGVAVPIVGGARLSGKIGKTSVGFLGMRTEELEDLPANDFTVARLSREFPNRTRIGAIAVARDSSGGLALPDSTNRTYGIDGQVGIGRHYDLSGFVAATETPGLVGSDHAFRLRGSYSSPTWRWSGEYGEVGDNFNPEAGFVSRSGYRRPSFFLFRRIRPVDLAGLKEIRPRFFYNGYWRFDGFQESASASLATSFEWRNGFEVEFDVQNQLEGLRESFEVWPGIVVPVGTYRENEFSVDVRTSRARALSGGVRLGSGGFFGGRQVSLRPEVRLRIGEFLTSELSWSRNDIALPAGDFTTNLARLRVTYAFSTSVLLQALVQYNDSSDDVSTNLRFSWLARANTGLFVVLNENRGFGADAFERPGRSVAIKYTRLIDVFD